MGSEPTLDYQKDAVGGRKFDLQELSGGVGHASHVP